LADGVADGFALSVATLDDPPPFPFAAVTVSRSSVAVVQFCSVGLKLIALLWLPGIEDGPMSALPVTVRSEGPVHEMLQFEETVGDVKVLLVTVTLIGVLEGPVAEHFD
jgi:hypothetical protein